MHGHARALHVISRKLQKLTRVRNIFNESDSLLGGSITAQTTLCGEKPKMGMARYINLAPEIQTEDQPYEASNTTNTSKTSSPLELLERIYKFGTSLKSQIPLSLIHNMSWVQTQIRAATSIASSRVPSRSRSRARHDTKRQRCMEGQMDRDRTKIASYLNDSLGSPLLISEDRCEKECDDMADTRNIESWADNDEASKAMVLS